MSKFEKILKLFRQKPYLIKMGADNISKRYDVPIDVINEARKLIQQEKKRGKTFNILSFDIETSPMKAFVWSRWKQNVYLDQTISEWFMLCWAAKWLGSDEVLSDSVTYKEVLVEDETRISKSLWALIDQDDILVAHNG